MVKVQLRLKTICLEHTVPEEQMKTVQKTILNIMKRLNQNKLQKSQRKPGRRTKITREISKLVILEMKKFQPNQNMRKIKLINELLKLMIKSNRIRNDQVEFQKNKKDVKAEIEKKDATAEDEDVK